MGKDAKLFWGCMWALVLIAFTISVIIFGHLISIWSLNTLFPILAIPYTLETWFSVLWLLGGIGGIIQGFIYGFSKAKKS